jgi:hypothetical protein
MTYLWLHHASPSIARMAARTMATLNTSCMADV